MKISGTKSGSSTRGSSSAGKASKKDKVSASQLSPLSSNDTVDAVEVSDHVATIEIIRNLVNESPEIRVDEVERVANKLKTGQYKIDYEKIAEAFIKDVIVSEIAKKAKKGGKR